MNRGANGYPKKSWILSKTRSDRIILIHAP